MSGSAAKYRRRRDIPREGTVPPQPPPVVHSPQLPRLLHGKPEPGESRFTKGRRRVEVPRERAQAEAVRRLRQMHGLVDGAEVAPPIVQQSSEVDFAGGVAVVCRAMGPRHRPDAVARVLTRAVAADALKIRIDTMISLEPPRFRTADLAEWGIQAARWIEAELEKDARAPVTLEQAIRDFVARGGSVTEAALLDEAQRCGFAPGRAELRRLRDAISPARRGRPRAAK
jgi:hypothetical protein